MAIGSGVAKQVRYKKEATFKTAPGTGSAQLLRRVTSELNLAMDAYQSAELRSDYQVQDMRLGQRSVRGPIRGELSCTSYADFIAAALRKNFAAGVSASSMTITVSASGKTFTRSTGSWLSDGFKIGDVVRYTGFTAGYVGMNNVNYRIGALTATIMTVLESTGLVDCSNQASIGCSVTGKKTHAPVSGHTDDSFAIEHWFSDVSMSELFLGCKVSALEIAMPPTGMATINIDFIGADAQNAGAAYYVTPTAETTTGVLSAATGNICIGGTDYATVTGLRLRIDGGYSPAQVAFSNSAPAIFPGRVRVSGEVSVYLENATLRDAFVNETDVALFFTLKDGTATNAAFTNIVLPLVNLSGQSKSDGEIGIVQTFPFTALLNGAGGTGIATEKTTISIQDSQLV